MIKILGEFGWYYFDVKKIDGFSFDLNRSFLKVFLNGQTIAFYVKEVKDILTFVNTITGEEKEWFIELNLEILLE